MIRPKPVARAASVILAALALAGCEATGGAVGLNGPRIAEVEAPDASFADNIGSLSEVVRRNPGAAEPYNTRGAAYARAGKFQEAIADFSQAIRINPQYAAAYTNRALALRQSGKNEPAPSPPTPTTRRPTLAAPICCAPRAICPTPWPISTRPSASTRKAPRPSMPAA